MINWYILHSRPNKEEFVLQQLTMRNITAYYPYIKAQPVNPRSRKIKPYFPGYLFVDANLDLIGTSALKWLPGAISLVSFGGELASVSDDFLQPIRNHVDQINETNGKPDKKFMPSDKVIIQSGPFAGFQAIFDSYLPGHERVRVLLQMLQARQMKIELSGERVKQINTRQSN